MKLIFALACSTGHAIRSPQRQASLTDGSRADLSTLYKCFALALVIFFLTFAQSARAGQTVTISKIEGTGAVDAVAIAVLTEAYKRLNVRMEVKELPSVRALAESSGGATDGELQRKEGLTAQYPNLIQLTVPINWIDLSVFTKTADFTPHGWESLRPYKIGFHRGILVIEEATRGMNVDTADSNASLLLKLAAGRTDIVVMNESDGIELTSEMAGAGIHRLSPPVAHLNLYHYLNKKNATLARKLEAVLRTMEQSGDIVRIHQQAVANFVGRGVKKSDLH